MSKKFSVPRGTSDILPDQISLWENVENAARRILKTYGYRELRTPVYEETALFKRSLGQTSDVVNKQLLHVTSRWPDNMSEALYLEDELKRDFVYDYALRPEGTASIVRSYLENSFDKKEPLSKFFYIGPMFRGERPQKGRLRQFHQIGVEAIGPNSVSPYLDAEVIALAMHLLKEFGVKQPKLRINSLGTKEDKEKNSLWLRGALTKHKIDLCEDCQGRLERNVLRILDCKKEQCRKVVQDAFKGPLGQGITMTLSPDSTNYFDNVRVCLDDLGITYETSLDLVRGLDYYTHTVFEITAGGELGSQDAVGAGGRFSGLVQDLGGDTKTDYGAIGFALGIERILLAAGKAQGEPAAIDAFVIAMDVAGQKQAFALTDSLRKAGISADMGHTGGKVGSQMNRANKLNAKFALILGEEELKNNAAAVKNMQTGTQETVALKNIVEHLRKVL